MARAPQRRRSTGTQAGRPARAPPRSRSDLLLGDLGGVALDEVEAMLRVSAHQPVDEVAHRLLRLVAVGQGDPDQRAALRVHGGLAKLRRIHLAEPLESADLDLLALEQGRLELAA